ncbi:MAG: HIT domain-containing protein [Candidatus Hodarchaeales archaeon]
MFCEIAQGTKPSIKIYEEERTVAFLDIAPLNPGHSFVIMRNQTANIYEISEEDVAEVAMTTSIVAKASVDLLRHL